MSVFKYLVVLGLFCTVGGCRNAPEPAQPEQPSSDGPRRAEGVTCPDEGAEPFSGVVAQDGQHYRLQKGRQSVPIWEIAMQASITPRSPDLSAQVGQEVVICGTFDGAAIYQARLIE